MATVKEEIQAAVASIKSEISKEVLEGIEARLEKVIGERKATANMPAFDEPTAAKTKAPKTFGAFVTALAKAGGDREKAHTLAMRAGDTDLAKAFEFSATKAMQADTLSAGGALVHEAYAADFIELQRAATVVRAAGAMQIDMPSGHLNLGRQDSGATAYWVDEGADGTVSDQATGNITLTAKKVIGLTVVSNDLLKYTTGAAERMVTNDLVNVCSIAQDTKFIRGTGASSTPQGLRYAAASANVNAMTGTPTAITVTADLLACPKLVELGDTRVTNGVFLMSPRVEFYLKGLRDAGGGLAFFNEMSTSKTIFGYKYFTTTSIPTNLGGGTESEVYFFETSQFIIGDAYGLQVEVFPNGVYENSGGTVISGINRDETVIRVIGSTDCKLRHANSAAVITGVTWGA